MSPLASQFVLWAIVTIALILAAGAITRRSDHDRRSRQAGAVQPLPGAVPNPCQVTDCGQPATTTIRAGFDDWPVCRDCRDELAAREPFDRGALSLWTTPTTSSGNFDRVEAGRQMARNLFKGVKRDD